MSMELNSSLTSISDARTFLQSTGLASDLAWVQAKGGREQWRCPMALAAFEETQ